MTLLKVRNYLGNNQESIRSLSKKTGVSRAAIYRMINHDENFEPKLSSLIAIANHFGCKVDDLIDERAYGRGECSEF